MIGEMKREKEPEFFDFLGEGGCERAKFRHVAIRERSSEQVAVLRCCSAAVLRSKNSAAVLQSKEKRSRLEVRGLRRNDK